MYKAAVRWMIRRNIKAMDEGRYQPALKMFAEDAELRFPGANSWSRMFREPRIGQAPYATHRGHDEIEAFLQRYVGFGMQMVVDDILVNGPPWNLRAVALVHHYALGPDGEDLYNNRAALAIRSSWGKIQVQEDFEDTERVSAFDARLEAAEAPASA
jgi:ketosteroid isomerase-like protein